MTKNSIFSNLIWRFAERSGAQFVTFIVSIILARLLEPKVYGTVAIVTVFITILQVFVDSGLGNALIQKKDADSKDYSTVFYANIVFCIIIYILLFLASPFISAFYKMPELTPMMRVMGLTIIISGIKNVQQAFVSKNMMFKKFFFSTLIGTIAAAVTGIFMAYMGFGVWSIIFQNLVNQAIDTFVLWYTVKWRPSREFSFLRLKFLFSYGWKILVSSLLHTIYTDLRQLLIGKFYTAESLAFYNKGKQFPNLVATNISESINSVLFPAMSSVQDDEDAIRNMTRKSIRVSGYVMWPMLLGLAAVADTLVSLLLTDKWLPCVPFLRILCLSSALQPMQTANLNAFKAIGRADLVLKLEIIKKTVGILMIIITLPFGVLAIAYSMVAFSIFAHIVNSWPNRKLLNYSYFKQLLDILPFITFSIIMFIPVYFMQYIPLPTVIVLALQVIAGFLIYLTESIVFKVEEMNLILSVLKIRKNK